jgi:hypothetical protein
MCYDVSMKFYDATVLKDAKSSEERRYRNILANSGQIMESGEIRDLDNLYVMGRDGKPIAIKTLNNNPDKQTEEYTVKAQADHGEIKDGELYDTIEKQFGSCKVWLEEDGLHARMYFANDDRLADHAYAISEDASYSTGIDWFPDGYYGVGLNIEEPIGILREISMVLTGNDPRAKTIDHKDAEATRTMGSDVVDAEDGDNNKESGESEMSKTQDELTPKENTVMKQKLAEDLVEKVAEVVDEFTTDVPESEVQPTAREDAKADEPEVEESKDSEEATAPEAPAEAPAEEEVAEAPAEEETKDTVVHNININFRDRAVKNETPVVSKDAKAEAKKAQFNAIRDALKASNFKFDAKFTAALESKDAITGLGTPLNITNMFTDAMEHNDGILSYIYHIGGANGRGLRNNALAGDYDYGNGAFGHKPGDEKEDEDLTNTIRVAYDKMIYKKLTLDAMEIYENPELIEFRSRELLDQILLSIERAIFIGDGREEDTPDLRMFDSATSTGLFPIADDCSAQSGYGTLVASSYTVNAGDNLYDGVVGARQWIRSEGDQILVVKPTVLTAAFQAKVGNRYLIEPGATAEDIFRVARVFSPMWMEYANDDAYLLVRNGYTTTGERSPRVYPFFDVNTNQNILLNEMPLGGTLTKYKSAAAIKGLSESES